MIVRNNYCLAAILVIASWLSGCATQAPSLTADQVNAMLTA